MTNHHDPKSTRVFNAPQKKPADSFQWDLDQEMRDHIARVKHIMSSTSIENAGVGGGEGLSTAPAVDQDSVDTPTHPHTPVIPSLPTSQTPQQQKDELCKIFAWLEKHKITSINYLLRKYSPDEILGAIEDYDSAVASKYKIHSPTGFFRRLLEPASPDRQQPPPEQSLKTDPDKYIQGRYGHMVQR